MGHPHSVRNILTLTTTLLVFGQIMLFSASGVMGLQRFGSEFHYSFRQGICALLGLGLMWILSRVRSNFWKRATPSLFALQLILIGMTLFSPFRLQAQGAARWLSISGLTIQPSELARITLSFYVAYLLSEREKCGFSFKQWLAHAGLVAVLLAMILRQPDLGSTVLLILLILGALFISGIRPVILAGMLGVGAAGLVVAMLTSDYRRRRLTAFLNPWSEPQGAGFQTIQSLLSIHSGKLTGVGIGNGNSKLFYLPEVHTDFIFSLTAEELGFIGGLLVIGLFALLGFFLFRAASKVSDSFERYVVFCLSLSLMLQVCVNIGGVTGLVPIKGLPLPFFSWGRSALFTHLATIGIITSCLKGPRKVSLPTSSAIAALEQRLT